MGVRVKIRLCVQNQCAILRALVNSGYETEEPELAIPQNVAEKLGIWPPRKFTLEEAYTAGGLAPIYVVDEEAKVSLVLNDDYVENVKVKLVINPYLDEPIISDHLIDALGIVVISFGKGLWRHRSDPENTIRKSE